MKIRAKITPRPVLAAALSLLAACATTPQPPSASQPAPPSTAAAPSAPSSAAPGADVPAEATRPTGKEDEAAASLSDRTADSADPQATPLRSDPQAGEVEAGEESSSATAPQATSTAKAARAAEIPAGGAKTRVERKADLDRELDRSLAEFEELLQREQEKLARQQASAPAPGEAGGPGGGDRYGGDSAGGDGDSGDGSDLTEDSTGGSTEELSGGEERGERDDAGAGDEEPSGRVPPDIPSGDDDDIVARQLREAAMEEEDPELREKLWQEYRDYRGLDGGGTADD